MVEGDSVSMLGFTGTVDIRVLVVYLSGLVFFFKCCGHQSGMNATQRRPLRAPV